MANIYFLFIMVLQIIPPISISGGQPAILMPLLFVIVVSAIKDLFEDIQRHKSDNVENNRKVLVANRHTKLFEVKTWKEVKIGNIVKIEKDQFFPADLVVLNSSAPKGICYVETKNLDGETNLKHKSSHKEILHHCSTEEETLVFMSTITCEKPSDKIYQFEGVIIHNQKRISLSYDNFLLRGSSLKNTDWVYGVVTFTGHDTRIMKNSSGAKVKRSRVEQQTNFHIIYIFFLQLAFCLVATVIGTIWNQTHLDTSWYLDLDPVGDTNPFDIYWGLNAIQRFGTWILIFT
jgi:phospholipid-transporting ATPase